MQDDAQLKLWLDAARRGDVEAFGHIVSHLRPRIARIVARYATKDEDREDLLQDVFLRAFRSLKKYTGRGSFEGWLCKVAIYTSIDWLRAKMRRKEKTESELSDDEQNWIQSRLSDSTIGSPLKKRKGIWRKKFYTKRSMNCRQRTEQR